MPIVRAISGPGGLVFRRGNDMTREPRDGNENADAAHDPLGDAELRARRARLDAALEGRAKKKARAEQGGAWFSSRDTAGWNQAFRLSSEFIGGIAIGGAIGWGIDYLLGTLPFGLIIFLLLGFVAGILNVMRAVGRMPPPEDRIGK